MQYRQMDLLPFAARSNTRFERCFYNIARSALKDMRERDLEAARSDAQIITGCTQNLKFDWNLDMIAKLAYYGIDSNKLMLLQNMRYPRASKRWMWISNYYKMERLFADMDNHSKPNLYAVTHWSIECNGSNRNFTHDLQIDLQNQGIIQLVKRWHEMVRGGQNNET